MIASEVSEMTYNYFRTLQKIGYKDDDSVSGILALILLPEVMEDLTADIKNPYVRLEYKELVDRALYCLKQSDCLYETSGVSCR